MTKSRRTVTDQAVPASCGRTFVAVMSALLTCASPVLAQDNPEPGLSGGPITGQEDGWGTPPLPRPIHKGVRVVGHEPIQGRKSNQQLVWIDHCAYVAGAPMLNDGGVKVGPTDRFIATDGVAVIDVRDPSKPRQVGLLRERGALRTVETIDAVDAGSRKVLAVGDYAGGNVAFAYKDPPVLNIYDVSDCARPKLMAEYTWPENVHTLTISADGKRIYAPSLSQKEPLGTGGIHVLDISDLRKPRHVGRFQATAPDGRSWDFEAHQMSVSPDQRRIYAGVVQSLGAGDLNDGRKIEQSEAGGNEAGGIYILDNSELVDGKPDPKMRLLGVVPRGGWHSVMMAKFDGVPHLVGAAENGRCPGAFPRITNIADETRPKLVGEFRLSVNQLRYCDVTKQTDSVPSTHFADVDDAEHSRLGLFNFQEAGLRIADLRDPRDPIEIAYFRPGDSCTGHVRYVPASSQMWLTCQMSGFWVLELAPEVKALMARPRHGSPQR